MNLAYVNGQYTPLSEARISPLDRGFLFGDGIYEVIPCYDGRFVAWSGHMQRMLSGLAELQIILPISTDELLSIAQRVVAESEDENLGLYIQVTRGAAPVRKHAFPENTTPTVFVTAFAIPALVAEGVQIKGGAVQTERDIRWQRCDIKSVSLLGSVLHYQSAHEKQLQETILLDEQDRVKEASTSNVFIAKQGCIVTPPLSTALLPGITRDIIMSLLKQYTSHKIEERFFSLQELRDADECWITSASRGAAPVTFCDGKAINDGQVGPIATQLVDLYRQHLFDF